MHCTARNSSYVRPTGTTSYTLDRSKTLSVPQSLTHAPNLLKVRDRFFPGRRVEACCYVGQERFKHSKGEADDARGDGADSDRNRLDDLTRRSMIEDEARARASLVARILLSMFTLGFPRVESMHTITSSTILGMGVEHGGSLYKHKVIA